MASKPKTEFQKRKRPFRRRGGPSKPSGPGLKQGVPDGAAVRCGCKQARAPAKVHLGRRPEVERRMGAYWRTIEGIVVTLPGWVHVQSYGTFKEVQLNHANRVVPNAEGKLGYWQPKPEDPATEVEREIEGKLQESFQTWTDVPLYQWHRWYDWNFWVKPTDRTEYVAGWSNNMSRNQRIIECEWDTGAALGHNGLSMTSQTSVFFHGTSDEKGVREMQIGWPMAGQHVWLAGRWIYDCGHPPYRTELHPIKAWATARWQGVRVSPKALYAAGLRFTFFANRSGGYYNFPHLYSGRGQSSKRKSYTFLLELPSHPQRKHISQFTIKNERQFGEPTPTVFVTWSPTFNAKAKSMPIARVNIRTSMLRVRLDKQPFRMLHLNGLTKMANIKTKVTFLDARRREITLDKPYSREPGSTTGWHPPAYARVEIPLATANSGDNYFGTHVDMAWEGDGITDVVTRYVVHFDSLIFFRYVPAGTIEFGVNGIWNQKRFWMRSRFSRIMLNRKVAVYLGPNDTLDIACSGHVEKKLTGVGDWMRSNSPGERKLEVGGKVVSWDDVVKSRGADMERMINAVAGKLWYTFERQNTPMGRVNKRHYPVHILTPGGLPKAPKPAEAIKIAKETADKGWPKVAKRLRGTAASRGHVMGVAGARGFYMDSHGNPKKKSKWDPDARFKRGKAWEYLLFYTITTGDE